MVGQAIQAIFDNITADTSYEVELIRSRLRHEVCKVLGKYDRHDCEVFIYYDAAIVIHQILANDIDELVEKYSRYGNVIKALDLIYREPPEVADRIAKIVALNQVIMDHVKDDDVRSGTVICNSTATRFDDIKTSFEILNQLALHERTIYYSFCHPAQIELAYMITQDPSHCLIVQQRCFTIDAHQRYNGLLNIPLSVWERSPNIDNCYEEMREWVRIARSRSYVGRRCLEIARRLVRQ